MVIIVIIVLIIFLYFICYFKYSKSIINFMLNVKCFQNIYYNTERLLLEMSDDEVIEIYNKYYKFIVEKEKLEEYYCFMLSNSDELNRKYDMIKSNMLYGMDIDLEEMLDDAYFRAEEIRRKIRFRKWEESRC